MISKTKLNTLKVDYKKRGRVEAFYFAHFIYNLARFIRRGATRDNRIATLHRWLQRVADIFSLYLKKRGLNYLYRDRVLRSLFDFEKKRRAFIEKERKKKFRKKYGWSEFIPRKLSGGSFYQFFQFKRRTAIRNTTKKQYSCDQIAVFKDYSSMAAIGGFTVRKYIKKRTREILQPFISIFTKRIRQYSAFFFKSKTWWLDNKSTSIAACGCWCSYFERSSIRVIAASVKGFYKVSLVTQISANKKNL